MDILVVQLLCYGSKQRLYQLIYRPILRFRLPAYIKYGLIFLSYQPQYWSYRPIFRSYRSFYTKSTSTISDILNLEITIRKGKEISQKNRLHPQVYHMWRKGTYQLYWFFPFLCAILLLIFSNFLEFIFEQDKNIPSLSQYRIEASSNLSGRSLRNTMLRSRTFSEGKLRYHLMI